ncbi:DNA alkylation repair protein [Martelella mediterranea]|uniref:DNA alkylation repair enzyme n=1 Tax=Martelella mediterranea DSM 17316 TaxID=1122214 RepID=A0A1U9Z761_9HYPH|nr:DNA alkylation repair protein [Martelella mediterranea]AQZ53521.1 DNA alkylation repair enzyme [Martelella mediterranea DSM 17316]
MLSRNSSADAVLAALEASADPALIAGMDRVGIRTEHAIGLSNPALRQIAREIGVEHGRAVALWQSPVREAKLLALLTFDPERLKPDEMFALAGDFTSWEMVDMAADLFVEAGLDPALIARFAADDREFARRTAFAMVAGAAVHCKSEPDETFIAFLPLIEAHAGDDRNFVKKAVNWALRNIGMRNRPCHAAALALAEKLAGSEDRTRRWIGRDAVKYLSDPKRLARLKG